jgi:hypothetical protein
MSFGVAFLHIDASFAFLAPETTRPEDSAKVVKGSIAVVDVLSLEVLLRRS